MAMKKSDSFWRLIFNLLVLLVDAVFFEERTFSKQLAGWDCWKSVGLFSAAWPCQLLRAKEPLTLIIEAASSPAVTFLNQTVIVWVRMFYSCRTTTASSRTHLNFSLIWKKVWQAFFMEVLSFRFLNGCDTHSCLHAILCCWQSRVDGPHV